MRNYVLSVTRSRPIRLSRNVKKGMLDKKNNVWKLSQTFAGYSLLCTVQYAIFTSKNNLKYVIVNNKQNNKLF